MKKVRVAILGIGTVGGGTYQILTENHDWIAAARGLDIEVLAGHFRQQIADIIDNGVDDRQTLPKIFC